MKSRNQVRLRRKRKIRAKIKGTQSIPRLCVFRSLTGIYIQVIDDTKSKTLISASGKDLGNKFSNTISGAKELGKAIAEKCASQKIMKVVFDRGGYKYHGKVKALADGAREGGLKF